MELVTLCTLPHNNLCTVKIIVFLATLDVTCNACRMCINRKWRADMPIRNEHFVINIKDATLISGSNGFCISNSIIIFCWYQFLSKKHRLNRPYPSKSRMPYSLTVMYLRSLLWHFLFVYYCLCAHPPYVICYILRVFKFPQK